MGLKRILRNWLLEEEEYGNKEPGRRLRYDEPVCSTSGGGSTNPCPEANTMLNFRVYNAVGSYIVEFHRYDRRTDENHNSLYTVSHDDDFGDAIAKIAAAEIIKQ